jgi:type I site-specific restriction-modification system R (restriction) subunit
LFINGIPIAIFEFKTAIDENNTTHDTWEQIHIRYCRDIPKKPEIVQKAMIVCNSREIAFSLLKEIIRCVRVYTDKIATLTHAS